MEAVMADARVRAQTVDRSQWERTRQRRAPWAMGDVRVDRAGDVMLSRVMHRRTTCWHLATESVPVAVVGERTSRSPAEWGVVGGGRAYEQEMSIHKGM